MEQKRRYYHGQHRGGQKKVVHVLVQYARLEAELRKHKGKLTQLHEGQAGGAGHLEPMAQEQNRAVGGEKLHGQHYARGREHQAGMIPNV